MCHAFSIIYLEYESHDILFLHGFLLTPGGCYNCETAMRVFGTGLCREVFDSKGYLFLKKNELLNKLMTVHDTLGGP